MAAEKHRIFRRGPRGGIKKVEGVEEIEGVEGEIDVLLKDGDKRLMVTDARWLRRCNLRRTLPRKTFYYTEVQPEKEGAERHKKDLIMLETEPADLDFPKEEHIGRPDRRMIQKLTPGQKILVDDVRTFINGRKANGLFQAYGAETGFSIQVLDEIDSALDKEHVTDIEDAIMDMTLKTANALGTLMGDMIQEPARALLGQKQGRQDKFYNSLYTMTLRSLEKGLETRMDIPNEVKGAFVVFRNRFFQDTTSSKEMLEDALDDCDFLFEEQKYPTILDDSLNISFCRARAQIKHEHSRDNKDDFEIGKETKSILNRTLDYEEKGAYEPHIEALRLLERCPTELVFLFGNMNARVWELAEEMDMPDDIVLAFMRQRSMLAGVGVGETISSQQLRKASESSKNMDDLKKIKQ